MCYLSVTLYKNPSTHSFSCGFSFIVCLISRKFKNIYGFATHRIDYSIFLVDFGQLLTRLIEYLRKLLRWALSRWLVYWVEGEGDKVGPITEVATPVLDMVVSARATLEEEAAKVYNSWSERWSNSNNKSSE